MTETRQDVEGLAAAYQQLQSDLLDVQAHLGQVWYAGMDREADEMRHEAYLQAVCERCGRREAITDREEEA